LDAATLALAGAFLVVAILFSSVGHAGASGYLAAMALVGLAPETMKPTALALNILVGGIVTVRFHAAGLVPWRSVVPFVAGSIPLAFVGGALVLPAEAYKPLVGAVLLFAAYRLFRTAGVVEGKSGDGVVVPAVPAVLVGGAIGLLAGLTGTGGGVFLTPFLLFARWAPARLAAGMSAAFILANSLSGLAGNFAAVQALPAPLPLWLAAVAAGGLVGAELGARRLAVPALRRVLALVLVVAGLKLILIG
jgi:uncharacterized protein